MELNNYYHEIYDKISFYNIEYDVSKILYYNNNY